MKWFLNIKIGSKLISAFVFIALIGLVIGLVGVVSIGNMDEQVEEIGSVRLPSIQTLLTISEAQTAIKVVERTLLIHDLEDDVYNDQFDRYQDALNRVDQAWAIYAPLPQTKQETIEWNKFVVEWDEWKSDVADYMKMIEVYHAITESNTTELNEMLYDLKVISLTVNAASFTKSETTLIKIIDINKEVGAAAVIAADDVMASSRLILIVAIVIGLILSILLGVVLSNIISKPIKTILTAANKIADGDLNVEIALDTKDEVGQLGKAFDVMTLKINEVMSNINNASEQVASGSSQLSDSSMSLSQGSTEQASSIEELTASVEEISTQTRANATNAEKAKNVALSAYNHAEKGNEQMIDMLSAMSDINESSKNISKIIKVIDDIAFQTNILALNAAVEAARAGQHGKGFAVVAEEVRNLAARSANAAKETTAMIESSISKVEGGTKIAKTTADALAMIVAGVSEASELVGKIATASNEQAIGVEQVNLGLTQISTVIQTTSATAEETAAASEELSSQADLLKQQVNTFSLKNSNKHTRELNLDVRNMYQGRPSNEKKIRQISLSDSAFEKY